MVAAFFMAVVELLEIMQGVSLALGRAGSGDVNAEFGNIGR